MLERANGQAQPKRPVLARVSCYASATPWHAMLQRHHSSGPDAVSDVPGSAAQAALIHLCHITPSTHPDRHESRLVVEMCCGK